MNLYDVYPLFDVNIVKGEGCKVWDDKGNEYLDLYGGHAVISIGHAHPCYVNMISRQVATLGFYSNSVINTLQQRVAAKLGRISGYEDYNLFFINSGAEANENALKLSSFKNGKKRVIAFKKAFHGRTSLAVEVTDNPKIVAPINAPIYGIDFFIASLVSFLPICSKISVNAFFSKPCLPAFSKAFFAALFARARICVNNRVTPFFSAIATQPFLTVCWTVVVCVRSITFAITPDNSVPVFAFGFSPLTNISEAIASSAGSFLTS